MLNPALFYRYRETRSIATRNEIVSQNLGLVKTIANRFKCHEPFDDVYHQGVIGLINAVERFDPYAGYQFSSYAAKFIRGEILHYLRDRSNMIRPRRGSEPIRVVSSSAFIKKDGRSTMMRAERGDESIEMVGVIADTASDHTDLKLDVRRCICSLGMRERRIVRLYYFDGLLYKDIAKILKVHPCTVQRTMQRCIEKLKESLSEYAQ